MGAWIETSQSGNVSAVYSVAPYMGAWIETNPAFMAFHMAFPSLPIWERGLKQAGHGGFCRITAVAPYIGAWIETGD